MVTVRRRLTHRLVFRANYTYGKSLHTASGRNLNLERGPLGLRHAPRCHHEFRMRTAIAAESAGSGTAYIGQPFNARN